MSILTGLIPTPISKLSIILKQYLPILAVVFATACTPKNTLIEDWESYSTEHEQWQHTRIERLKSDNGWANLAGLFWLEEGENTIGSDSSNSIIFPEAYPAFGGSISLVQMSEAGTALENAKVEDTLTQENEEKSDDAKKDKYILKFIPEAGASTTIDGKSLTEVVLKSDASKDKTMVSNGDFRWFIIKRGDNYGIRLRNLKHPRLAKLDHIPAYEFNKDYVVEAEFIEYENVMKIEVPTVIDDYSEEYEVPGELQFKINGKQQTLLPFKSGDGYFLIVGDATNGLETYGAGRFLYCSQIEGNKVLIDFNKLYNPPCAFSPYATCPLPPFENILDVELAVGEKGVHLD